MKPYQEEKKEDIVFYKAEGKECVCGVSSFSHIHHRGNLHELRPIIKGNDTELLVGGNPTSQEPWEKDIEKRFIQWAQSRDDDWWENGQGHICIWDFRIMLDFFQQELSSQRRTLLKKVEKIIGKDEKHTDHTDKEEWYSCVHCMEEEPRNIFRKELRQKLDALKKGGR